MNNNLLLKQSIGRQKAFWTYYSNNMNFADIQKRFEQVYQFISILNLNSTYVHFKDPMHGP